MNPTLDDIPATVKALSRLTVPELKQRYAEVFGEPTRTNHKQYLIKRIVWRMQALREGGLSERARRRALELADDAEIASARNDKLFLDGQDLAHLSREVRYVIGGGAETATRFRVIVLPQSWSQDPWQGVEEPDQPSQWDDRIPVLVLPDSPPKPEATLGRWLRDNLQKNRNAVRFLIPQDGSTNLFTDRDLIVLARCVYRAA